MSPVVSIVVPVYNLELHVKKMLDSLINQVVRNIEIIVIDDGSKDNTLKF